MASLPKKLAVLVSGGGTNMQSVLDSIDNCEINGKVVAVISSNATAFALVRAKNANIDSYVCALADYKSREDRDKHLLKILQKYNVDYILLAGYLGIITSEIICAYPNKIVNIHPALLPKYGGHNYFGMNVHRAVIAARESFSGATVHFVDNSVDTGLIIAQECLPVESTDTAETLQERILNTIEHKLFVSVVKDLCDDKIKIVNNKVVKE